MTIQWLIGAASCVPDDDEWLGPQEQAVLAELHVAKRRADWRLGRYLTKQTLRLLGEADALDRIEIIADAHGVPRAFVAERPSTHQISISHREGIGACAASTDRVGCDLERVEPRTARFVEDFFTERERVAVDRLRGPLREQQIALTWSAKESALKFLQVGLRRDTRSVEVRAEPSDAVGWKSLSATVEREGLTLHGWWRREEDMVFTVVSTDESVLPIALELPRSRPG